MSNFKFSNLYGSVYLKGNVVFTSDGYSVISPVGNRVTVYDLKQNRNYTFETRNRKNISLMCLSNDDNMLITIDEDGQCVCSNFKRRIPIHYFNFKSRVKCVKFSPDNKYIAAGLERELRIYQLPISQPQFRPFFLHKKITGFTDEAIYCDWHHDCISICIGMKDSTIKIIKLDSDTLKHPILRGFKGAVLGCYFENNSSNLFGIDKFGILIKFEYIQKTNFWNRDSKHKVRVDTSMVSCVSFEKTTSILVIGFDTGLFTIFDYVSMEKIQQISVTNNKINSIAINNTSDWLALASSTLGQLVVWEYKTENYVLRQQGHSMGIKCTSYSPDGCTIVTGSEDGKIKLWNTHSGFCYITFEEHSAAVSYVIFSNSGQFVLTASLDGTCRAFDLNRYRNFRTLVTSEPMQFSYVSIDTSDELVCASAIDSFNICIWSLMTGRLLEMVSGHSSPVSCLKFVPNTSHLITCSWDYNTFVWDVLNTASPIASNSFSSECICVAVHPFKPIVAVCTIRANINFWNFDSDQTIGVIEGGKDLGLSRKIADKITAETSSKFIYFTSAEYSSDGQLLIACGKSKYICIYDIASFVLIHRIDTCCNQSLDGVLVRLNSRKVTEAGNIDLLDAADSEEEDMMMEKSKIKIPGVKKHDLSLRKHNTRELSLQGVSICPTCRSFVCVSTEGLLMYSKDEQHRFDPVLLTTEITTEYVQQLLIHPENHQTALICSAKINQVDLICECLESVAIPQINLIVSYLPLWVVIRLLQVVADSIENQSPHLEFYLIWCNALLMSHGLKLKNAVADISGNLLPLIRKLQKCLNHHVNHMGQLYK